MNPHLVVAVECLIGQIQQYESNSFSASQYGITREMAEQIAARLIGDLIRGANTPENQIEGIFLKQAVEEVQNSSLSTGIGLHQNRF